MTQVQQYSLCDLKEEVGALVARGAVGRKQRIYSLSKFFSNSDWLRIEQLLEANDYLLRDPVLELVGQEVWIND